MNIKFKKLIKAFGGKALYFDKEMLRHINLDDEVKIILEKDSIIIKRPLDFTQVKVDT